MLPLHCLPVLIEPMIHICRHGLQATGPQLGAQTALQSLSARDDVLTSTGQDVRADNESGKLQIRFTISPCHHACLQTCWAQTHDQRTCQSEPQRGMNPSASILQPGAAGESTGSGRDLHTAEGQQALSRSTCPAHSPTQSPGRQLAALSADSSHLAEKRFGSAGTILLLVRYQHASLLWPCCCAELCTG